MRFLRRVTKSSYDFRAFGFYHDRIRSAMVLYYNSLNLCCEHRDLVQTLSELKLNTLDASIFAFLLSDHFPLCLSCACALNPRQRSASQSDKRPIRKCIYTSSIEVKFLEIEYCFWCARLNATANKTHTHTRTHGVVMENKVSIVSINDVVVEKIHFTCLR